MLWLLDELKLPYELEMFRRNKSNQMAPPELAKVHPLGKSPVVDLMLPGAAEPAVRLAESGMIFEYLCDHFAGGGDGTNTLVPKKWQDGKEGKIGGETKEWLRFKYIMHYSEGSLMPILLMALIMMRMFGALLHPSAQREHRMTKETGLKSSAVPFFIRPISSAIANRIISIFVTPNVKKHLAMLDSFLADGKPYLCGDALTAADILMSYPLIAGKERFHMMLNLDKGTTPEAAFPNLYAYIDRIEAEPGYIQSVKKVREIDSSFKTLPLKGDPKN